MCDEFQGGEAKFPWDGMVTFELTPKYADRYLDEEHSTQKQQKGESWKHESLVCSMPGDYHHHCGTFKSVSRNFEGWSLASFFLTWLCFHSVLCFEPVLSLQ